MTAQQFRAWRAHMKMSKRAAAEALGLGQATVDLYELGHRRDDKTRAVPIPLHVELACAALALGITRYDGPTT